MIIIGTTTAFSVLWFLCMAILHAAVVGSNPVVFGGGLTLGAVLFGIVVSLIRDHMLPRLERRSVG